MKIDEDRKRLVAQILDMPVEGIDNFVVITIGVCDECGERNGISVTHNTETLEKLHDLIEAGVLSITEGVLSGEIFNDDDQHENDLYCGRDTSASSACI